jgi:hypothetical protein
MRHAGGAARLIELRGPDQFQSDFELSLFIAHTGPIVSNTADQEAQVFKLTVDY